MAQQAGRPAKAGKTTNQAVGADAAAAVGAGAAATTDCAAATHPEMPATDQVMHMDFSNVSSGPYGIDPRTKEPYSTTRKRFQMVYMTIRLLLHDFSDFA